MKINELIKYSFLMINFARFINSLIERDALGNFPEVVEDNKTLERCQQKLNTILEHFTNFQEMIISLQSSTIFVMPEPTNEPVHISQNPILYSDYKNDINAFTLNWNKLYQQIEKLGKNVNAMLSKPCEQTEPIDIKVVNSAEHLFNNTMTQRIKNILSTTRGCLSICLIVFFVIACTVGITFTLLAIL